MEYVLIDFENVQPKNLELLKEHPFKVIVFCGANQARIPLAFASAMQDLGINARYVHMSGSGRNALDFHIAFYLGELAAADPAARFHIISRDSGFDPLIRHLANRNLQGRGQSRPRKVKTLSNTINSLFTRKLESSELEALIDELKERRYISVATAKSATT